MSSANDSELYWSYAHIIFPAGFASQGVSIEMLQWLDGARRPPIFLEIIRKSKKFDELGNYKYGFSVTQWKGINCKQSTRWQHLSRLKASAHSFFANFFSCYETRQLILGTGTAIWWMTEPHWSFQPVQNRRTPKARTWCKRSWKSSEYWRWSNLLKKFLKNCCELLAKDTCLAQYLRPKELSR